MGSESWDERQSEMEEWYREFMAAPGAETSLLADYEPYADVLAGFKGRIIDVGGGAGLARRYLPSGCEYVVVDPSSIWLEPEWQELSRRFGQGRVIPVFLQGVGENLPFEPASFDGYLAFWSLNHATDPLACLDEAFRVLKPGGKLLIVLEDMEPTWVDVARFAWERLVNRYLPRRRRFPASYSGLNIRSIVAHKLSGHPWPLQQDHVRIDEAALSSKFNGRFIVAKRDWRGGFLSFEMRRSATPYE